LAGKVTKEKRLLKLEPRKKQQRAKAQALDHPDVDRWVSADAITGLAWILREAHFAVVRRVDAELDPFEVNSNMYRMMRALRIAGRPLSQIELIEHSSLNQSSTSTQLATLVQLGMLASATGQTDRRQVQYILTAKGRETEEALNTIALKVVLLGTHGLSENQLRSLRKMLGFIRDNLARHAPLDDVPEDVFEHATRTGALPKKLQA
jgi:DNA-binding MarR family transcriptional regulator